MKIKATKIAVNRHGDRLYKCSNCGFNEIEPEHKYCASCGGKIEEFLEEWND